MRKNERIACAGWLIPSTGSVIPVDTKSLPMDKWNWLNKNYPEIVKLVSNDIVFITTHGRIVDEIEAFTIALNANQLVETPSTTKRLATLDIWPRS